MLVIALVFIVISVQIEAKEINCESILWIETSSISLGSCHLNGTTTISEENVELGGLKNVNVGAIFFYNNKNIKFLPVKVHKTFPSLKWYVADNASIDKISALNFAGLSKLKFLFIDSNNIEVIPENCFQGLNNLKHIGLAKNKIKTVNALAFANLPDLSLVELNQNDCIDEYFMIGSDLSEIRRKLSRRCLSARPHVSCTTRAVVDEMILRDNRTLNVCFVEPNAYIDKSDLRLLWNSTNSECEEIWIKDQRHADFLPVLVHEQCPSLRTYFIINTPIRKISKKNFEKLQLLEDLTLNRNQIEFIKSDTFEDLISLKSIFIRDQPLIALNGKAFTILPQLETVNLQDIRCIDEYSFGPTTNEDFNGISENCGFDEFDSVDIECESYNGDLIRGGESCNMREKTAINGTNFVIAVLKDEKVKGIDFSENSKIEYLPYKIYMQFPYLVKIDAGSCSIKQISKQNFESLNRLEDIVLSHNQIQKIFGDTFKGLKSLRKVNLSNNRIKSISGRTFDQLPMLSQVDLEGNECINNELALWKSDGTAAHWNEMKKNFTRKIIQQCAFTETGEREFEKVFDIECGVGKSGQGFIVGGNETQRGQWPFKVALILTTKNQFFCGGSIITALHVLTAAHCIQNKHAEKPFKASEIALLLGRHNLELQAEVGSEIRGVKEIKIHPRWNTNDMKFEGDIAVLQMDRPVKFSAIIQPVCLTFEPELSQKEAGYVVGWGKSESSARHENIPRQVLISSVTGDVCFAKDFMLGSMFSEGMFCAGGDGFGPCQGDSGGGFFVRYEGLWTLKGVVSSGTTRAGGGCEVDRYTLFTNAVDYATWIKDACKVNATLEASSLQEKDIGRESFNIKRPTKKPIAGRDVITIGNRVYLIKKQYGLF